MRHCRALFKKHVLPWLYSPEPILHEGGQDVSIRDDHRDLGCEDPGTDFGVGAVGVVEGLGSALF